MNVDGYYEWVVFFDNASTFYPCATVKDGKIETTHWDITEHQIGRTLDEHREWIKSRGVGGKVVSFTERRFSKRPERHHGPVYHFGLVEA